MSKFGSRRGGAVGALLVVGAGMICLALVVGIAIARNVRVAVVHNAMDNAESNAGAHRYGGGNHGDNVSIETPAGRFSIHAHDESGWALVDVPIYPGARQAPHSGGSAVFEWTSNTGRDDKGFTVAGGEMITSDPVDRVVEYYQSKLPSWVIASDRGGKFQMELADGGYKRMVVIEGKYDGTHIGVATIGAPAAN